jgi:ribosomal protein S18 acetylase RimI-like enzyme
VLSGFEGCVFDEPFPVLPAGHGYIRYAGLAMMRIQEADLADSQHASAMVELVDSYARGPSGQNAPLTEVARGNMAEGLRSHPMACALLAFVDDRPVGVAICIWGFSTFAGRPTVNVCDFAVRPDSQNQGIGRALLDEVEARARLRGCCKMTLEVHDTNDGAKRLYRRFGFGPWDLPTLFVSKPLR